MEDINQVNEPIANYGQPLTFEKVWLMFQETDRKFQETDRKFQETDRVLTEKFQETDKLFRETGKRIIKLDQLFTTQWGKLIESLVEGNLVKLLQAKSIKVERTSQRVKGIYKGKNYEFDIIASNGTEAVVVEVKTTLRPADVQDFHLRLRNAKTYVSELRNKTVYGAMAFLTADGSSDRMAENTGLFVIRATGSSSSIINAENFVPKIF